MLHPRWSRILHSLSALLLLIGGSGFLGQTPHPAAARAATDGQFAFLPITLAAPGAVETGGGQVNEIQISGDWVRYRQSWQPCPWCSLVPGPNIDLVNALTRQQVHIKTSSVRTFNYLYLADTYTDLQFVAPRLIWTQIDQARGEQDGTFYPGDFDCTRCYFDLSTGQGGAWTGGSLTTEPPSPWRVVIQEGPTRDSPDTIRVMNQTTGQEVIHATLDFLDGHFPWGPAYRAPALAPVTASSADKLVWVERGPDVTDPNPQFIRLLWLVPPAPVFQQVWAKADADVAAGKAGRPWLWGPAPRYLGQEPYAEGANGARQVLYYDKARMEVNNPSANPGDPNYVTNGLLTVEMIGGAFQVGNTATITASVPCTIPVAGDPRAFNPFTPDYATLASVASLHGNHQAPARLGQPVNDAIDVHGIVSTDALHGNLAHYATFVPQTGHNIPDVFWTYLQAMQATYGFDWRFVLGYPIMEGYWTQMRVGGKDYAVLIQAYQRRVLTYVPDFAPAWQIQQGNVGQHYLEWRYTLNP